VVFLQATNGDCFKLPKADIEKQTAIIYDPANKMFDEDDDIMLEDDKGNHLPNLQDTGDDLLAILDPTLPDKLVLCGTLEEEEPWMINSIIHQQQQFMIWYHLWIYSRRLPKVSPRKTQLRCIYSNTLFKAN
jgi:hypothetical protein